MKRPLFILFLAIGCVASTAQGRQLTGPHAPSGSPALPPLEAVRSFQVPEGFEVRLFASEPMVVNPVAMTWDDRGRLWVVELFEYPLGAPPGSKPRDTIKILEDVDGDGTADKMTVFADGLNLATGILLGYGGAYVGQAPHLLFLQDTDGDDVADKRTVLLDGFGMEDRHELLNGFTWGPDGWIYMTHGVFTHSKVKNPNDPEDDGVIMNAAVARVHPLTHQFEVFADGTSNPWGVDFDAKGNAFVSACVIDHLFHMAPGGLYARQAGSPEFKHAYELIPSIVEHRHYRAAYAGIQIYQGNQYPKSYQGRVFMGNIHANAVVQDSLQTNGSSFKAHEEEDFLVSSDGWFRPVSEQVGPDGALWVMDWYDKYPCYQNARADPEGVDREYGRIWRVVYTGDKKGAPVASHEPGLNLASLNGRELVMILKHPNIWHRKTALRILSERKNPALIPVLEKLIDTEMESAPRLAALWTLHGSGQLSESLLDQLARDKDPSMRTWTARLTGERRRVSDSSLRRLFELAEDSDPSVRLAVATACRQFVSGSLTVNTPGPAPDSGMRAAPVLARLILNSYSKEDPLIPFLIWMSMEPMVVSDPGGVLDWFHENGDAAWPLTGKLVYKTLRRIGDTGDLERIGPAVDWMIPTSEKAGRMVERALAGLMDTPGIRDLQVDAWTRRQMEKLLESEPPEVRVKARYLAALWGSSLATADLVRALEAEDQDLESKRGIIHQAARIGGASVENALLGLLKGIRTGDSAGSLIQAIGQLGPANAGPILVEKWGSYNSSTKQAVLQAMISRSEWTPILLDAIETRLVDPAILPATMIRQLTENKDGTIRKRSQQAIGRFRPANLDVEKLIHEKKLMILSGTPDIEAGRLVAEAACLTCHKLHGQGAEIGPDLTGVGRSTLDALLANVINPNQIIGTGYENVEIETRDDRILSGRLTEQTDTYVKLLSPGPMEHIVSRSNIKELRVSELSVMPEGLEQMPDDDFRNLIWFILNPPEDNRPMTEALYRELAGERPEEKSKDYESIALWSPAWKIQSAENDLAPDKLPDHMGVKNVLVTYPFQHQGAAVLERKAEIPKAGHTHLKIKVMAHPQGRWVLRVFADEKLVLKEPINQSNQWREVIVDLSPFAGKTIPLRLENYASNMEKDFAYWADVTISHSTQP